MKFLISEYSAAQRKQYINAKQLYEHYIQKKHHYYLNYNISMYWRESGGRQYLTKKSSRHSKVTSLGAKSPETEKIYQDFTAHKHALKEELKALKEKVEKNRKLNKIELLGRAPSALIEIYQKINELGLDEKMLLIGTNALYAYEAYCGVFVDEGQLATDDIDLLNKQNKELSVVFDEVLPEGKLTQLLKLIDKSFEADESVPYRFRNKEGVLLEVITPVQCKDAYGNQTASRFTDVLELTMEGMQWLENSRIFKSMVVGSNGKCAMVSTIHPLEFAVYKNWLSLQPDREVIKKNRDYQQAQLVTQLIQEYMVNIDITKELSSMKHFKKSVVSAYRKEIEL